MSIYRTVECDECGTILREFRKAVEQDEQRLRSRLHQAADASGREPDEMRRERSAFVQPGGVLDSVFSFGERKPAVLAPWLYKSGMLPMRLAWVSSIANMPTDEMHTIMRAHYPRIADIRRKQAEHEARTGHSVFRDGWRTMKMPYEELLRVMRVLSAIR